MQRCLGCFMTRTPLRLAARSGLYGDIRTPCKLVMHRQFHRSAQVLAWEEIFHVAGDLKPILEVVGLVGAGFLGGYTAYLQVIISPSFRVRSRSLLFDFIGDEREER